MRIKLNLMQLTLDKNPSIYWLHVDLNYISLVKQLKKKIQKVLKESRDIELCVEDVPFLDEDDIHVINENEEITVVIKEINNSSESNCFETNAQILNTSNISSNNNVSTENIKLKLDHDQESSSVVQMNSKKRTRKRTHKKKKQLIEPVEPVENSFVDIQSETSITSLKEPSKMHKRFKIDNGPNHEDVSSSGSEESLHVQREVFRCNSSSLNVEKKDNTPLPVFFNKPPIKTKITKVPVFVRGQSCTSKNSLGNSSHNENENIQTNESSTSEDYDQIVIDWKDLNPVKISNISELQIHDLLQFKTLCMNECGESGMSSVITARLVHIYKNTLHIQVLSGIKEFMNVNSKFSIDNEENNEREVEFGDIFEVSKLI